MSELSNVTTTVTAPDIVCGGCASAIKKALERVEGVSEVNVDIGGKKVSVEHQPDVDREKIISVLDRAGFPAS